MGKDQTKQGPLMGKDQTKQGPLMDQDQTNHCRRPTDGRGPDESPIHSRATTRAEPPSSTRNYQRKTTSRPNSTN